MNMDGLYSSQNPRKDQSEIVTNGHNGRFNNTLNGEEQPLAARHPASKQHWLARKLHITPTKDH
jgi:hypothetical protein